MIINTLARRRWGRIVLLPFVIWCGAWSWFSYLDGTKNQQDASRVRSWWGWLSPGMDPHWGLLSDPTDPEYGSWFHSTKNIGAEWARLDPQRAYKAMSFALVAALLLLLTVLVIVAVTS
jgi:hypothetical protein